MGPAIKDRVGVIPGKDGRQGYQYGYATLAACFEAIRPMHAQGIAVTQIPLDGGNEGGETNNLVRYRDNFFNVVAGWDQMIPVSVLKPCFFCHANNVVAGHTKPSFSSCVMVRAMPS